MKSRMFLFFLCIVFTAQAQETFLIWPAHKMPNSKELNLKDSINNERLFNVNEPKIHAFFTSIQENNGAAVLIIPGGGYHHLSYNISGYQLAKWFNTLGITAFVLDHRLPTSIDLVQKEIAPLQDAQRAIKYIRANAKKWSINSDKIGVMGSSAGGHLAAILATTKDDVSKIKDALDQFSFHPNFMILVSPVIDMGTFAHKGSKENLLGKNPSQAMIQKYSAQLQVDAQTPICFIADAFNDKTVNPMNSLLFYQSLLTHQIPTSFHVFPQGGHAIALRNNPGSANLWTSLCEAWMKESNIITPIK